MYILEIVSRYCVEVRIERMSEVLGQKDFRHDMSDGSLISAGYLVAK